MSSGAQCAALGARMQDDGAREPAESRGGGELAEVLPKLRQAAAAVTESDKQGRPETVERL